MKLDEKPTQEEPMIKILYRKPVMSRGRAGSCERSLKLDTHQAARIK